MKDQLPAKAVWRRLAISVPAQLLGLPLLALAGWEVLAWTLRINAPARNGPGTVFPSLVFADRPWLRDFAMDVWKYILPTLGRWVMIFASCSIAGLVIGAVLASIDRVRGIALALLDFLRSLPSIVLFTYFMALLPDRLATLAPAAYSTLFVCAFFGANAWERFPRVRLQYLRQCGASPWFLLRHCVTYEIASTYLVGCRAAVSLSYVVLISAEMIQGNSATRTLGWYLEDFKQNYQFEQQAAAIMLIGLIGVYVNRAVAGLERVIIYWKSPDML